MTRFVTDDNQQSDLAYSLCVLGNALLHLEQYQEAVAALDESVEIYRQLGEINPAYLPNLASALSSASIAKMLQCEEDPTADEMHEALAEMNEAAELRRHWEHEVPLLADLFQSIDGTIDELGY